LAVKITKEKENYVCIILVPLENSLRNISSSPLLMDGEAPIVCLGKAAFCKPFPCFLSMYPESYHNSHSDVPIQTKFSPLLFLPVLEICRQDVKYVLNS